VLQPIVIFSDLLPPKRGGLADHTFRLAELLQRADHQVTVISSNGVSGSDSFAVRPVMDDWHDMAMLEAELSAIPTDALLLWQYVPHMYGHGGVNATLPRFIRRLHRAGRRQVVLAHEIAAPYAWHPAHCWYAWNHRRQWNTILRHADVIPISTSRWVEDWSARRKDVAKKLFTLPSPSSIPRLSFSPEDRLAWRREHRLPDNAKVIAYFGMVNPSKRIPWVIEGWRHSLRPGEPVAFTLIGAAPELPLASDLRALYRPLGFVKAAEVSRALNAADLVALPFIDGISERRTTLMAALDHGVAVAGTVGHCTGSALAKADWLGLARADDGDGYIRLVRDLMHDDSRRAKIAAAGKAQHDAEFSWPVVVQRLRDRFPV
jgi:glycosyltransferase involved in cell wall biosynthesis